MSSSDLRVRVHKKLESVDGYLRKEVLTMIDFEAEEGVFKLSDTPKLVIDESRDQIKDSNSFTNEEVKKEIAAWLSK